MELYRDSPLLEHIQSVCVVGTNQEESFRVLTLRLIPGLRAQKEKIIHLEITDNEDSFFLFFLDVGESDFHTLKREQAILIDFPVFAEHLIELIIACGGKKDTSENVSSLLSSSSAMNKMPSSFHAKLDIAEERFSIFESNAFKQITHISLKLRRGNDAAIKDYLASRLHYSIERNKTAEEECRNLHAQLIEERKEKKEMLSELDTLRNLREVEVQTLKANHMNEINVLQMSHMESFNSLKLTYAEDSKLLTSNYERIIANSNAKIASLESNLTTLQFECNDLNAKLKESMAISQTQSTEILQLKSNLSKELAEKADLIQLNRSLEKEVLKCNSKIDSLMQQIKDKEDYISQSAQLSQADADKCSYLSEKLVNYENMIQVFQSKLETSSQEILKGNSYIQKISSENKMLKEKVERKSEVLRRQEALVIELRSKNGDLESSSASSLLKQRELEHRITQLNGDVQQLNAKLAESEQVIASNQNVIMYLNQLVNTEQIGSYIPFLDDYKSAPSSGMTCEPKTPAGLPKSSRSRYDGTNPLSEGGGGMPTTVGKASVVSYSPDSVTQQPAHYERQDQAQTPYYRTPAANHGRESNQSPPHSMTGDNEIYLQGLRYLGLGSSPSKLKEFGIHGDHLKGGKSVAQRYSWQKPDFGVE